MALHREDVIRAAVDLLDEVGLDRLTTRALTTRLGVQPGALYWHVRSKSELLSAIADEIMRNPDVPHLGMQETVHQAAVDHSASADSSADR